jgi:CheY-like chemotaxis protein
VKILHRLLLADDSITIHKVVELVLSGEGFEIKMTSDGEDALAAIPSFSPDIVLADVEMPKMNGYLLCEKIKQDPSTSRIPVLLLAGAFEPFDEESAKKVGADGFVIKPFDAQELISKIHDAIASAAGREEGTFGVSQAAPAEGATVEEDLWAMEEITGPGDIEKLLPEDEAEIGKEEIYQAAKEMGISLDEEPKKAAPSLAEEAVPVEEAGILEAELPSKEELKEIFEKNLDSKVSLLFASVDLKDVISSSFSPVIKDSVDKILGEAVPDIAEKVIHTELKGALRETAITPLIKDAIGKILGETVPHITERAMHDQLKGIFEETVNAQINSLLSSVDIKETVASSLTSLVKEPIEKAVSEIVPSVTEKVLTDTLKPFMESLTKEAERAINTNVPEVTERIFKDTLSNSLGPVVQATEERMGEVLPELIVRMLREELKVSFESLKKEVERVIWKAVPDLAESLISKEIERIRSEF